ncbi:MAG TPA: DUF6377 domain-containing protein [Hanamia sp.]
MKRVLYFLFFVLTALTTREETQDSLFTALESAIKQSQQYDAKKEAEITQLKQSLGNIANNDIYKQADITSMLYEAYKTFNYDSALLYAKKLQAISYKLQDKPRIIDSKIKISFILVSAGLFKDAFDSLNTIIVEGLTDSIKAEYFSLMGRAYYDLGDFDNDKAYTPAYYQKGNQYLDSALTYFSPSSYSYFYYKGLLLLKMGKIAQARVAIQNILTRQDLSFHQKALAKSTLSGVYEQMKRPNEQLSLLMEAAIDDIKSATKETTATLYLSSLLFKKNDLKRAFLCVEKSIQDAIFYGARQRQVQISSILPIIEGTRINVIEGQRGRLILYSSIVTLLLLLLICFIIVAYKQNKKLKKAKQIITEANIKQQEINHQLIEANKIKEEYMIHSYNISANFLTRMEWLRDAFEKKIHDRKFEEIKFLLNNMHLKAEKQEMLFGFDKVFLKLFPDFIDNFNSLFQEEDRVPLNEDGSLSTGMRIFALIRMGITDNDKIAQILEYSVNTIYAYKTKFKKKAIVSSKEFDDIIMQSKAF